MQNKQKNTSLKITEYIKNDIELGILKPSEKLPSERDLVKKFGVSRSSIREAIKSLTVMGYVEPIKRKGTFVSKKYIDNQYANCQLKKTFDAAPIFDLMEVRIILEEKFIPLAVRRANNENIDKLNKAIEKLKKSDSLYDFFKADQEFHYALAEATNNSIIIEIMKVILNRINCNDYAFITTGSQTKENTIRAFTKIVHHIINKNTEEATLLYHNHLYLVDDVLKKLFVEVEYDI